MKDLSEKYEVSQGALRFHSAAEDWKSQRKEYLNGLVRTAQARTKAQMGEEYEENFLRENRIVARISALLEKATEEQMEIISISADGEVVSRVDVSALEKAAKILKQIEEIKRSIMGITTVQEDRMFELNQKRLEIEEKRLARDTGDNDEGGGVLILPEIDGYEGGGNG